MIDNPERTANTRPAPKFSTDALLHTIAQAPAGITTAELVAKHNSNQRTMRTRLGKLAIYGKIARTDFTGPDRRASPNTDARWIIPDARKEAVMAKRKVSP